MNVLLASADTIDVGVDLHWREDEESTTEDTRIRRATGSSVRSDSCL